jgi:hypothetical protein
MLAFIFLLLFFLLGICIILLYGAMLFTVAVSGQEMNHMYDAIIIFREV